MSTPEPDFAELDFFRTRSLHQDPYPYYELLRERGPAWREPHHGVVMVIGYAEAMAVYRDPATFSSCNAVSGPFQKFSEPAVGADITDYIVKFRHELPFSDQLPAFDPPNHTSTGYVTIAV